MRGGLCAIGKPWLLTAVTRRPGGRGAFHGQICVRIRAGFRRVRRSDSLQCRHSDAEIFLLEGPQASFGWKIFHLEDSMPSKRAESPDLMGFIRIRRGRLMVSRVIL